MPPTPLTADYRVVWRYTVLTFVHKAEFFLDCVASGDASGFDTVGQNGHSGVGVSTIKEEWPALWAPFCQSPDVSFDSMQLEHRVGTTWVFAYNVACTTTPSGTDPSIKGMGFCVAGKSDDNKEMNTFVYELGVATIGKHASYSALSINEKNVVDHFYAVGATPSDTWLYAWRLSRGKHASGRWLSNVFDTNEKLRRLRRIK